MIAISSKTGSFIHGRMTTRVYFRRTIEELARQPRKEESRLYVWIVDRVDEMTDVMSLRPLLPSIESLPIMRISLNSPGVKLWVISDLFTVDVRRC